jgi:hypothetical protein
LGVTWGWGGLVGDRGHRKGEGQLRVLSSPSALHTKEPRTGGPPGGAGSPRARFVFCESESPLILGTYLGALKPDCGPPGPILRWARQIGRPLSTSYLAEIA